MNTVLKLDSEFASTEPPQLGFWIATVGVKQGASEPKKQR